MAQPMTRVRALAPLTYARRALQPGAEFEVETRHLMTLSMLGKVTEVSETPAKPKRGRYSRRDMRAHNG